MPDTYKNPAETGFYYLQSRYYDPAICRFINADTFATTDAEGLLSTNMFAYCENNPVIGSDPSGEFLNTIIGAVSGAVFGAVSALVTGENIKASIVTGAVSGAIAGVAADVIIATGGSAAVVMIAYAAGGGIGGALGNIAGSAVSGKQIEWGDVARDAVVGGVFGALGGATVGKVVPMMKKVTQTAGKKALAKGITVKYAIKKTTKAEFKNRGKTFISNTIGNFTSWYSQQRIKYMFGRK